MHLRHIVASHIVICDCHIVLFCAGCTLLPAGCTHCHVPWLHDLAAHGRKWPLNLLPAESARGGWCDWIRMHVGIGRSEQYSVCVCVMYGMHTLYWWSLSEPFWVHHCRSQFRTITRPARPPYCMRCGVCVHQICIYFVCSAIFFFIFHFLSSSWSSVLCILFAHWHWCSNGLAVHHHHHHRHYNGCCRCCRCRHTASSSSSIIRPPLISVMGNEEHARDLQHILQ